MELLLADNGVGIEKDDLKHIFERLYKCDKGRSEKGSGLGLSIVHQLVEKMGGSITLKVFREKELNLLCFFLWRFKRVPVFMAGTFVIFAGFQIARLMQGCGKVNARLA